MLSSKYNYDRNAIDQQPRGDYSAIMIASLSLVLIGIFMILGGGTVTFVYYTEITPQNHEAYYDRYVSTNASRILGKLRYNNRKIVLSTIFSN